MLTTSASISSNGSKHRETCDENGGITSQPSMINTFLQENLFDVVVKKQTNKEVSSTCLLSRNAGKMTRFFFVNH